MRYVSAPASAWTVSRPRTLEEVGAELGITRERVRQLESRALRELRLVAPDLEHYLAQLSGLPTLSARLSGYELHLAQARELAERLDLDLAHALARQPERATDLLERTWLVALDAVAHAQYRALALGQRS